MDEVWKAIEAIGSLLVGIAAVIAAVKSKGDERHPYRSPSRRIYGEGLAGSTRAADSE